MGGVHKGVCVCARPLGSHPGLLFTTQQHWGLGGGGTPTPPPPLDPPSPGSVYGGDIQFGLTDRLKPGAPPPPPKRAKFSSGLSADQESARRL